MRAQAAVDPEAERGVPVDRAVDDDLAGPVELRRVAVGGREAPPGAAPVMQATI